MILVYSLQPPGYEGCLYFLLVFVLGVGIILTQLYALNASHFILSHPLFLGQCGQIKTIHIQQTSVPAVKIHLELLPPVARK